MWHGAPVPHATPLFITLVYISFFFTKYWTKNKIIDLNNKYKWHRNRITNIIISYNKTIKPKIFFFYQFSHYHYYYVYIFIFFQRFLKLFRNFYIFSFSENFYLFMIFENCLTKTTSFYYFFLLFPEKWIIH